MNLLFITSKKADYLQDIVFTGLWQLLDGAFYTFPWNYKLHLGVRRYPKNLGYVAGSFWKSLKRTPFKRIDVAVVASTTKDCFESYLAIADRLPPRCLRVMIDGGDNQEIGGDFARRGQENLFAVADRTYPFDIIFKREMIVDTAYPERVHPLPFGFPMTRLRHLRFDRTPAYDVAFWASESHEDRIAVFDAIRDRFDCAANGSVRGIGHRNFTRTGDHYLRELARCRISLCIRGGGWDTLRYWEIPAIGGFMITQPPRIRIPDNFVHGEHVIFCKDDLSDIVGLCEEYLAKERERAAIAERGHQHLRAYHTAAARAAYVVKTIRAVRG
jgi:hypothetical protein